ncbi:MAG TPA: response regulator [Sandaracinaceae bacterium LLY-WYZ-13_1]|nr:response regulator [Sandaracinaceae bacterium LLY-WYZ-13_1]
MTQPPRPLLLLLDDDELWLRSLSRRLRMEGYRTVTFGTAAEALDGIAEHEPDLCVIDYLLGGDQDGSDVAFRARDRFGDACPPLVLVSGTLEQVPTDRLRPFDGTYGKDLDARQLVAEITATLTSGDRPRSHSRLRPIDRRDPTPTGRFRQKG